MKNLSYLNKFFWKYRYRLILGVLFVFLSNLFTVYKPLIIQQAVDFLISTTNKLGQFPVKTELPPLFETIRNWFNLDILRQTEFEKGDLTKLMTTCGVIVVVLYILISVISGFFLFLTRQTIIIMSRLIEFDLKNIIYKHYQKLHFAFYKVHRTGDLMNRISEDVTKVRMYLGPAVMYTANLIARAILAITFMVSISPKLSMYVLIPLPVMSVLIYVVGRMINKQSDIIQTQQSKLTSYVQESISGIRVLKAFNRTGQYNAFFNEETEDFKQKQLHLVKINTLFMPIIMLLIGISTLLTIYIGSQMIINGEGLTPGDLTAFVVYINMLTWPFAAVGWVSSMAQQAAASQGRINQFLQEEPQLVSGELAPNQPLGDIVFQNVEFVYPESNIKALKGVNLTFAQGKTTAIIGRTGSGKSTIANLIMRLYDVDNGKITVGGIDLKSLDLKAYRDQLGYVPQEVFLFSDTIEHNIAFGSTEADNHEKVVEMAKMANVHQNIIDFQDQYNTVVGEWGITLSGGQKQRVSIARALIRNPKLLIFDDSLSAVDTETEEQILQNLSAVMDDKTVIMISHRISSIKNADHILVLNQGMVVEQGTHDELLELRGDYRSIYDKQLTQEGKKMEN